MRSDTDGDLTASLTSIARLIHHASELAARSVEAAQAGKSGSAMNLALEVELLLDEAARMLEVAFTIRMQGQEILDTPGEDGKDPIRN